MSGTVVPLWTGLQGIHQPNQHSHFSSSLEQHAAIFGVAISTNGLFPCRPQAADKASPCPQSPTPSLETLHLGFSPTGRFWVGWCGHGHYLLLQVRLTWDLHTPKPSPSKSASFLASQSYPGGDPTLMGYMRNCILYFLL